MLTGKFNLLYCIVFYNQLQQGAQMYNSVPTGTLLHSVASYSAVVYSLHRYYYFINISWVFYCIAFDAKMCSQADHKDKGDGCDGGGVTRLVEAEPVEKRCCL